MNYRGRLILITRTQRIAAFGRELRRRREEGGFDAKQFAAKISISPQHLSQLETAYARPGRPAVGPGDDVIEAISDALGWRIIDIRRMLGQIPEDQGGPLETIVMEAGYEADDLDETQREELRVALDRAVIGVMEQQKRARRKG